MNRLTKQISLVLISSSLVLHGCYADPAEEEKKKEEEKAASSASGTPGYRGSHYYPYHSGPHFFHTGSWGSSRIGSGSGVRSGMGGSVRGGFGASAHGVGS